MSDSLRKDAPSAPTPAVALTRNTAVLIGVAVVLLAFAAAFFGSWLAQSTGSTSAAAPVPSESLIEDEAEAEAEAEKDVAEEVIDEEVYEEILEEITSAGASVRAGTGAPGAGQGIAGEVYLDITSSNVYVFRDGGWAFATNLRHEAAENLAGAPGKPGEAGKQGDAGAQGETGAQGEAGTPGTRLQLGTAAPEGTCTTEGDVFVNTATLTFFECEGGSWVSYTPDDAAIEE